MTFSLEAIEKLKAAGKIRGYVVQDKTKEVEKKKSIYGNKKTEVDGIVFDSKKEAKRYKELKLLLKAGKIAYLERQIPYELNEGGTHSLKYICDFRYVDPETGKKIVEDVKGFRKKLYLKKKKLMLKVHGIVIKET